MNNFGSNYYSFNFIFFKSTTILPITYFYAVSNLYYFLIIISITDYHTYCIERYITQKDFLERQMKEIYDVKIKALSHLENYQIIV